MLLRASVVAVALGFAGSALAVDFGVMETADVVETGKVKFAAHPLSIGDDNSLRDDFAVRTTPMVQTQAQTQTQTQTSS